MLSVVMSYQLLNRAYNGLVIGLVIMVNQNYLLKFLHHNKVIFIFLHAWLLIMMGVDVPISGLRDQYFGTSPRLLDNQKGNETGTRSRVLFVPLVSRPLRGH